MVRNTKERMEAKKLSDDWTRYQKDFSKRINKATQDEIKKGNPLVEQFSIRAKEIKKQYKGKHPDKATVMKELNKFREDFKRELIKKYPKDKENILRTSKVMAKETNMKLRFNELMKIYAKRNLTKKET